MKKKKADLPRRYLEKNCICSICNLEHADCVNVENPPPLFRLSAAGRWVPAGPDRKRLPGKLAYSQQCDECIAKKDPAFAAKYAAFKKGLIDG